MKIMLLKPQREVANSVLAYQDEDDDRVVEHVSYDYTWREDYQCDLESARCEFHPNIGDCQEYADLYRLASGRIYYTVGCI